MDSATIASVRRFNRVVTQRVGALEDRYLSQEQSLAEARVLYEIGLAGEKGREIGDLRATLELDSGYLSRLLRSLEADHLVTVEPSVADRRRRLARLSAEGRSRLAIFDTRSNELVEEMLAPLTPVQRDRLVASMADVERLLSASMVSIELVDPESASARACLAAFVAELGARFVRGFDPTTSAPAGPALLRPPSGAFLVGTLHGEPVACGALKHDGSGVAEIKRMWVSPAVRGYGLGRRILLALEREAAERGVRELRLETNGSLGEAIAMYRAAGYIEIPRFGDDPYAEHWFGKRLDKESISAR